MAKQFLPQNRDWKQRNDGSGTIRGSYNVDFDAERGKVRVSKPLRKIFDENETFAGGGNSFDGYVAKFNSFPYDGSDAYFALADHIFYTTQTDSDLLDESNWLNDGQSDTPSVNNEQTDSVVFDSNLLVIDGDDIAAYEDDGITSSWDASWWQSTIGGSSGVNFKFLIVGEDNNLYILTENSKVYRVSPSGTRTESGQGTLDFSATEYTFTCVGKNSTRLFIGFSDGETGRGGVVEWDMGATTLTANRVHKLSSIPKCIATWDDLVIAVMSDGKIKYFDGTRFVDYTGMKLPKIDGVYDNFIHPNGWAIIDNYPHFLIKGTEFIEGRNNAFDKDTKTSTTFPSAVYCLDPEVGFYPRFALTNNNDTQTHYHLPAVHDVGALYSLPSSFTKFLASYEIYTGNESADVLGVVAYYDTQNTNDSKGWLMFTDVEKSSVSKNIELVHRMLESGCSMRAFYQEKEEDEQNASGVWNNTTHFHTTDTLVIDDKWVGWVKTGNGAGQLLRVDSVETSTNTTIVKFKDPNTFVSLNDEANIQFLKFRWMGDIDTTTVDYHTLTFPSASKTRKMRLLLELTQAAGTTTELDYAVYET